MTKSFHTSINRLFVRTMTILAVWINAIVGILFVSALAGLLAGVIGSGVIGSGRCFADDSQPLPVNDIKQDTPVDFANVILPILRRNCLACHNATMAKSDLNLESPKSMLQGGAMGAGLVPGNAADSAIFQTASHQNEPTMPPADNKVGASNLTPTELGLMRLWIDEGAKGEPAAAPKAITFQPLSNDAGSIYSVGVSPDGRFAAASLGNQVVVYRVGSRQEIARLSDPSLSPFQVADLDVIQSIAFSPDGLRIATSGFRAARLWQYQQALQTTDLPSTGAEASCFAVSRNGHLAAIGEANGVVELYDLAAAKKLRSIQAHDDEIICLAFDSSGNAFVTGSSSNELRIWNPEDGLQVGHIPLPSPPSAAVFISQDSQIATGHADHRIRVWSTSQLSSEQAKSVREFIGHNGPVTALTVADALGSQLVSAGTDGVALRWETASGNIVQRYPHGEPIHSIAIRLDGRRVATSSLAGKVKLWNGENGQLIGDLSLDTPSQRNLEHQQLTLELARLQVANGKSDLENATKLKVEEDANAVKSVEAVSKAESEVKLKTEAVLQPLAALDAAEMALALLKGELANAEAAKVEADSAQAQAAALLTSVQNGDEKMRTDAESAKAAADNAKQQAEAAIHELSMKVKAAETVQAATSAAHKKVLDEKLIAEANLQAAVQTVERVKQSGVKAGEAIPYFTTQLDALIAGEKQAADQLASLQSVINSVPVEQKPVVRSLSFSQDGRRLAVACSDGKTQLFGSESGDALELVFNASGDLVASTFMDDSRLMVLSQNQKIVVWDSASEGWTLERIVGLAGAPTPIHDGVTAVGFSRDGRLLATGSGEPTRSGELRFWDTANGELVHVVPDAHSDSIFCIEFSPDGKYVATAGADRFVKIFEVATGKWIKSLEGHTHHVLGVSWRMDGRWIVSGGADKVVKVWDVLTGEQVRTIAGFGKEVTAVQFLGASDQFLLATGDHQIATRNSGGGSGPNFDGATGFLYSLRASQNSKSIVAGGDDGVLRIWDRGGKAIADFDLRAR